MQRAEAGRPAGQRDVDALALERADELALADDVFALGEGLFEIALDEIGGAADDSALVRRELAHAAEQVGQRALAAEMGDAPLLQRRGVAGSVELADGGRAQLVEAPLPVSCRTGVRCRSWPVSEDTSCIEGK